MLHEMGLAFEMLLSSIFRKSYKHHRSKPHGTVSFETTWTVSFETTWDSFLRNHLGIGQG